MRLKEITKCKRTRASQCQCDRLEQISEDDSNSPVAAVCRLEHGDNVKGLVLLMQAKGTPTLIKGWVTGLESGKHGFHIHEYGDLSQGCESAGGHYNPDAVDHGDLETGHVGDLGNITASGDAVTKFSIIANRVSLMGDRSVVGRSLVVHENEDDLGKGGDSESLKTGNAGNRLACGVITLTEI